MNLLLIDNEPLLLMQLERAVKEVLPDAQLHSFVKAREGLEYAKTEKVDVAFLDIQMRGIDGLSLAKELVTLHPDTNIVFCTGFVEYALDAYDAYASDYLLKPISPEAIRKAMKRLRHPLKVDKRVKFSCFGNFEAFCDGKPISFGLSRTKELLAYLADRKGALCTNGEIITNLFGDDKPRGLSAQSPEGSAGHAGSGGVCRCHRPAAGQIGHRTPGHPLRLLRLV